MADNLGTRHGVARKIERTRYHFADVYGQILERKSAKLRIHPATEADVAQPGGQLGSYLPR